MYGVSEGKHRFAGAVVCHPAKRFWRGVPSYSATVHFAKGRGHGYLGSSAASEYFHCTSGTEHPQRTLPEGAGNHERPCCFYYWENKENLKTQEIYRYLCASSSWSLRGGMGRDVLLCIASPGAQFLSTIILDI